MHPIITLLSLFCLVGAVLQRPQERAEFASAHSSPETRTNGTPDVATRHPCIQDETRDSQPRIVRLTLGNVPAILRIPARITRPSIILWHGFAAPANEAELMEALPLDEIAAVKVYLGLPLFGSRAPSGAEQSLASRQATDFAALLFEPAVLGAAKELPSVVQALEQAGCLTQDEAIGLFGFSAGGTAALIALADREVHIGAVVTLNAPIGLTDDIRALEHVTGKPYRWTAQARRIAAESDVIFRAAAVAGGTPPVALMQIHGSQDTVVSGVGSDALEKSLRPRYIHAGVSARLRLLEVKDLGHDWTQGPARTQIQDAVGRWFDEHLGNRRPLE